VYDLLDRVPRRLLLLGYATALALITAALAWVAYRAMFSMFDVPDDDGYLLMSLRKFNAGGSLYDSVYSQYGPGVFVFVGGALRAAGVALTNDGARDVNLFLWLASTLLAGLVMLRLTGRLLVSASALVVTFLVLKTDINEPLHPGATIGFLLIAMVAAAVFLLPSRQRTGLAAVGAIGAALLSIKVNVGVFALLSAGFACVATMPDLRRHLPLKVVAGALLIVVPFALLSKHLGDADTLRFAAIVAIGVLGVVLVAPRLPPSRIPDGRSWLWLVGGAAAIVFLVGLVPIVTGTSPSQLVDGWFVRPAQTPGIQWVPLLVHPWAWVFGAVGLGGAIAARLGGLGPPSGWTRAISGAGRTVVGMLIWLSLVGPIFELPIDLTQSMVVGAPLLWVAMLDPRADSRDTSFIRTLIPALAALQFLHAYPMPGSQLSWSSLLLVFVAGICVSDGIDELKAAGLAWRPRLRAWPAIAALPVAAFGVWLCVKPLRQEVRLAKATYNSGVPLDLPGAREIRVSEPQALQLQELTGALRKHCSTFLTFPGMNSLNILSGEEPPVEMSGPWPFFFTTGEQRDIVEKVRDIPRFCLVWKPDLVAFWAGYSGNVVPQRPLVRFFKDDFSTLRNFSGYYLQVRKPSGET
jgi:hypothetical protein